jgi:hypothetical protein
VTETADGGAGPVRARSARTRGASGRARAPNPLLADLETERRRRPRVVPEPEPPGEPGERIDGRADDVAAGDREPGAHGVVCTVGLCPICTLVTAFGDARPELAEHLLLAGREVLLAMKVLIDARLQSEDSPVSAGGLERISIE